jgi:DNA-directed RNA polymerase subunit beta'
MKKSIDSSKLITSVTDTIKTKLHGYGLDDKTIHVNKIYVDDKNMNKLNSWSHLQKLKNNNRTLSIPIYGDFSLKKGNKVISQQKKLNIGQLPIQNANNTYLVDGIEYIVPQQLRRDPGVYTSLADNGLFVTSINSAKGRNYKIDLEPNSNVINIKIDGSKIPLLPILLELGFTKDKIIQHWGGDTTAKNIYAINETNANNSIGRKALEKLYKKFEYKPDPKATQDEMRKAVLNYLNTKTEFNPLVTQNTLGTPYSTLSPDAILDISKKLIDIVKKKQDFDDTENLMFKRVVNVKDFLKEKINQDFNKKMTASLNRNLKNKDTIKEIIRPGLFTESIKSFFNKSQISEASEQINPLHILSTKDKITLKGEGGITDTNVVSLGMKSLHPSYFGFIDPLHTPDGDPGLVNHIASTAYINQNGKLTTNFINTKTGKLTPLNVTQVYNLYVGTPDQYIIKPDTKPIPKTQKIKSFYQGKSYEMPPDKVQYILAHGTNVYDRSTNLVPFINSSSGNRITMAGKHAEQSISLVNRETPLVSTVTRLGNEFNKVIGSTCTITSPYNGTVKKITPTEIWIKTRTKLEKVEIRNNLELNQESFYHDEPIVKVGEKVIVGQLLAKNNWVDEKGRLALGVNARIGYFPYKGYNIEDGHVISQDFAEKLKSQHIHVQDLNIKKGELNLNKFKLNFKNKYKPENYSKLDNDGVVIKGSVVHKGDLLVAYGKPFESSEENKILGKLAKGFRNKLFDQSIVWHYDFPGQVIDVTKSSNLVKVKVKSEQIADITDKLAGRYGNKGIISNIVPTAEMPMTGDGKPLDIIFNPHGIGGRINISQLYEAALGKVADKTGKRYLVENFSIPNNWEYVNQELKKNNVNTNETIIDPVTKKELKTWNPKTKQFENPFSGVSYILKSVHQTRKKFDARARGAYSAIDMPSKDPEASHYVGTSASKQSPKAVDRLTLYSLLAHGSKDVVRDMFVNKGQRRDDVWDSLIHGTSIPPPQVSTATQKYWAMLRAAGVNVQQKGQFTLFPPLTDKDTLKLSSGRIPKPNLFLRGKDLVPLKNGMFDPALTGGSKNLTRYNHIDLGVKVPNPITKNAIKILLDMSDKDYDDILAGKKTVNGLTSTEYFEKSLKNIKVTPTITQLELDKKTAPKTKINIINRKLRYLRALESYGMQPEDYLISKLPVIPTKFRPILPLPNGSIEPAPINNLYRDTALATALANDKKMPKFFQNEAKAELYNTISGLVGVTEPTVNTQNSILNKRNLKSVLGELGGTGSPKHGFLHSKVLSKSQDFIGNSVIAIGPKLGVDEIGIPYEMAETMYEPWILRKLKNLGYKPTSYQEIKKQRPQLVRDILDQISKERPVIVNRNPSLHKGSVMAFNPILIEGKAVKLNPLILKPFNADFDGDQMPIHVPVSQEAVRQAYKMLPSVNFYNPKNDSPHLNFDQEYIAGISLMTENGQKTKLSFPSLQEAQKAYTENKLRVSDFIKIRGKETTLGRAELESMLPPELGVKVNRVFNKKDIQDIVQKLVTGGSVTKYTDVINKLKDFGAKYAYEEAYSFSLNDLKPRPDVRAKILNPAIAMVKKTNDVNKKAKIITEYANKAGTKLKADFLKDHNRFFLPAFYGSKNISQDVMQQIVSTPFYVAGVNDKLIETPVQKSYSEGLDVHDNFSMAYGARKGIVDKTSAVQDPGALAKELIGSFSGVVITGDDCGTHEGVEVPLNDVFNYQGRVLAESVNGLKAGTVLIGQALNNVRKGAKKTIKVRSPLKCKMYKGICSRCFGCNEHQVLPSIGDPIGLKAAQSIGETGTQSALSSFHRGGTVSAGSFRSGFDQTKYLLHMPDTIKNKATLSNVDGVVKTIKPIIGGQHVIVIDNDPNPYITRNPLLVKVGSKVKKSDPLDEGVIKLQELAELAPMNKVRSYITDQLEKSYAGTRILRRNTETVVKNVTGYCKITNPGSSPYIEEDTVPINFIEWIKSKKPIPTEDVIGWRLLNPVNIYKKGEIVTVDMALDLQKKGIKNVVVDGEGIKYENVLVGINKIPLIQPDLVKKMAFQRIKGALKEGPISGAISNIHGVYPEPGLILGTEFGLPDSPYY